MKDQSSISGYSYSHADHEHSHAYLLPTVMNELSAIHKRLGNAPPASSTSVAEMAALERTLRTRDGASPASTPQRKALRRPRMRTQIFGSRRDQPMTIWWRRMAAFPW